MDTTQTKFDDMEAFLRVAKYPLVKYTDMYVEQKEEAMEIIQTQVEKFTNQEGQVDLEKCTQTIKDQMDKKFGGNWHVVVGKGFSYEITYEAKNIIYMFVGGTTAVLLWKM